MFEEHFTFELKTLRCEAAYLKDIDFSECIKTYMSYIKSNNIFENILKRLLEKQIENCWNPDIKIYLTSNFDKIFSILKGYYEFSINSNLVGYYWESIKEIGAYSEIYEIEDLCEKNNWLYELSDSQTIIVYNLEGENINTFKLRIGNTYKIKGYWHGIHNGDISFKLLDTKEI